jgi:hypothetical protein
MRALAELVTSTGTKPQWTKGQAGDLNAYFRASPFV